MIYALVIFTFGNYPVHLADYSTLAYCEAAVSKIEDETSANAAICYPLLNAGMNR